MDRERVVRLDEEEVVEQERPSAVTIAGTRAAQHRHGDDREQERRRAVVEPGDLLEDGDDERTKRQRDEDDERIRPGPANPTPESVGSTEVVAGSGALQRRRAGHRQPPRTIRRASRLTRMNSVKWRHGRMWLGSPP